MIASLLVPLATASPAGADGGDYAITFRAAAPLTYDHTTGGGAWNDGTVGKNDDIVASLEGGDFQCGDIVTYLTEITRGSDLGGHATET
ncbi:MAG: hypothetical protein OES57_11400, partial [Acidimicrobiia bacterium]|nr:hypothetical protein [Acidimicrobiia bacterium]